MNRTGITFVVGMVVALGGLALRVSAHALATTWQRLGLNAWGGTTDPAAEHLYQTVGLSLFAFGLALLALAFGRWLFTGSAPPRLAVRQGPR